MLYWAQLAYPLHAAHTYTPTQLRTHYNAAALKLRRALKDANRSWNPDEDVLAGLFMDALAPACASHVEQKLPADSGPTLNQVVALAMKWESSNPGVGNHDGSSTKRVESTKCPSTLSSHKRKCKATRVTSTRGTLALVGR